MNWFKKLFGKASESGAQPVDDESKVREKAASQNNQKTLEVHHLIVLDESGSMSTVRKQTVDGCNETIQTVRKMQNLNADQRHYVSVYLFNSHDSRYVLKDAPIAEVRELGSKDYSPYACTPLFDAVGFTLTELKKILNDEVAAYVTIITDGDENVSRRYNIQMVRDLISELKGKRVIFSFIGANIDSKEYAREMGIDNSLQFSADESGTNEMWEHERRAKMRSSSRMWFSRRFYNDEERERFYKEENMGEYYDENTDSQRITPRLVKYLRPNEIFVFGSNIKGRHDGGAARYALDHFGAIYSQAEGPQGHSYAIPTVGVDIEEIYKAVQRFIEYARKRSDLIYLVTPIGCGNGGYAPYNIAPMFRDAIRMKNIKFPQEFWDYL